MGYGPVLDMFRRWHHAAIWYLLLAPSTANLNSKSESNNEQACIYIYTSRIAAGMNVAMSRWRFAYMFELLCDCHGPYWSMRQLSMQRSGTYKSLLYKHLYDCCVIPVGGLCTDYGCAYPVIVVVHCIVWLTLNHNCMYVKLICMSLRKL